MQRFDTTPGTIEGIWMGFDIDLPYDFMDAKGRNVKGTKSYIYIQGKNRGQRSELFKITVPNQYKDLVEELARKHNGKQLTLPVKIGYSYGRFTIELSE